MINFIKKLKTKWTILCVFSTFTVMSSSASAENQDYEQLAELQAIIFFMQKDCGIKLEEKQIHSIITSFMVERQIMVTINDNDVIEQLNIDRYRDLESIDVDLKSKCEGINKKLSPFFNKSFRIQS